MSQCPGERRTLADSMVSHVRCCVFCTQSSVWGCVCVSSSIGHADTLSCSLRTCSHLNRQHRTVRVCGCACVCAFIVSLFTLLYKQSKVTFKVTWSHHLCLNMQTSYFPLRLSPSPSQSDNDWVPAAPTKVNYCSTGDVVLNNALSF